MNECIRKIQLARSTWIRRFICAPGQVQPACSIPSAMDPNRIIADHAGVLRPIEYCVQRPPLGPGWHLGNLEMASYAERPHHASVWGT